MELVMMLMASSVAIWLLYILFQTLIYGALTCVTGTTGLWIGACARNSVELLDVGDHTITLAGLVAFFLLVACFKFMRSFLAAFSDALPRLTRPFSR